MVGAFKGFNALENYPNGAILPIIAGKRATSTGQLLKIHAA